jgi:MFS family permease
VANERQLASATSLMGMASSVGTAAGTAFLAPILLKLIGVRAVFYVAGFLLILAASRVLHVYSQRDVKQPRVRLQSGTRERVYGWLFSHTNVATMVGATILVSVLDVTMTTLAPIYVQDVLDRDAAETVYITAPAGLAMALSLLLLPPVVRLLGERVTAAIGFALAVVALVLLGFVEYADALPRFIDPLNPVNLLNRLGFDIGWKLRTAMFLCFPFGLGNGLTSNAVSVYINRRVPFGFQSRTFASATVLSSIVAIPLVLTLSAIATAIGVSIVLILTPLSMYGLLLFLLAIERRYSGGAETPATMVTKTFWEESDAVVEMPGSAQGEAPAS